MRSWFSCSVRELVEKDVESVVGQLSTAAADRRLTPNPESTSSWRWTVRTMASASSQLIEVLPESANWHVAFEYELPRRRRRIDVIVLAHDVVMLVEFKVGASSFDRAAKWQAQQYALDLRDFHLESHDRVIVPFLVATLAAESEAPVPDEKRQVLSVQAVTPSDLGRRLINRVQAYGFRGAPLDAPGWEESPYRPSPSIVEAAQQLYASHDVTEIASAGSSNLDLTVEALVELIEECRSEHRRGIAFITGAPGSGKTLAGLQVAHDPRLTRDEGTSAVFLSGNMPLVEVITGALAASSKAGPKKEEMRKIGAFVQHAFAFRNEYATDETRIPPEHVVLFDEAQRAWDAQQVARWTKGASLTSEPRILLDVMSRVTDWSLVVAMVGGGQEINRGEAGLAEWGEALRQSHADWLIRAAPAVLPGAPDRPGGRLFDEWPETLDVRMDERLHLTMNVRSPRAERLNQWVDALLDLNIAGCRASLPDPLEFPIALTRSLVAAKQWLKDHLDGDEEFRAGLVASADARRLRAWGLDTNTLRQDKAWADWFLRPRGDVRSSNQLEVPASNFDCQGLELDWAGLCWGNDLILDSIIGWSVRQFRGSRWMNTNAEKTRYTLNSYRVLLTRARRGQVIWVPEPEPGDVTLEPEYFDRVAALLLEAGAQSID